MLSDDVCRLLTGYVDGELNDRQRKAVEGLVQRSPEARQLLDQLQANANTLRKLPRRQLPSDFALQVAGAITTRQLHPGQRRSWQPSSRILAWAGAAASVLLAVGLGSFYYLSPARNQRAPFDAARDQELAQAQPMAKKESPFGSRRDLDKSAAAPLVKAAPVPVPSETGSSAGDRKAPQSMPTPPPSKPSDGTDKDAGAALAASPGKSNNLRVIPPGFPLTLSLGELNREEEKKRLRLVMEKGTGYHIELFCRGNGHALERLRAALSSQRIGLLVDDAAESRLKRGATEENYLLYAQEMTAVQLASVLERLASDDKEAEDKRRGSGEFENFTVCALAVEDSRVVAAFLGGDPLLPPAPGLRGSLVPDLYKPLPERAAAPANRSSLPPNGTPRLDRALVKPPEHSALLIPYGPGRPKTITSNPVRQFLSNRKPPQHGAVQVFLVLRHASG
jgi:anti-sigma factor RsiW